MSTLEGIVCRSIGDLKVVLIYVYIISWFSRLFDFAESYRIPTRPFSRSASRQHSGPLILMFEAGASGIANIHTKAETVYEVSVPG